MSAGRIRAKMRRFRDNWHRPRPHEDELNLLRAEIRCLRQEIAETREMTFAANNTWTTGRAPSLGYASNSLRNPRESHASQFVEQFAPPVDTSSFYEASTLHMDCQASLAASQAPSQAASSRIEFEYADSEASTSLRTRTLKEGFWQHRPAAVLLTTKSLNKENADQLSKLFGNGGPRTVGRPRPLQSMNLF